MSHPNVTGLPHAVYRHTQTRNKSRSLLFVPLAAYCLAAHVRAVFGTFSFVGRLASAVGSGPCCSHPVLAAARPRSRRYLPAASTAPARCPPHPESANKHNTAALSRVCYRCASLCESARVRARNMHTQAHTPCGVFADGGRLHEPMMRAKARTCDTVRICTRTPPASCAGCSSSASQRLRCSAAPPSGLPSAGSSFAPSADSSASAASTKHRHGSRADVKPPRPTDRYRGSGKYSRFSIHARRRRHQQCAQRQTTRVGLVTPLTAHSGVPAGGTLRERRPGKGTDVQRATTARSQPCAVPAHFLRRAPQGRPVG